LGGDLTAIRLCLDRLCPPRKDRHVTFDLPKMETAADAVVATSAIAAAVAVGELTPSEAGEFGAPCGRLYADAGSDGF
jgi:uroporphyrinogen-III synthase